MQCAGFSLRWHFLLQSMGSRELRLNSCGTCHKPRSNEACASQLLSLCCRAWKPSTHFHIPTLRWVSLVTQTLKNLPATWETQVQSLGQEDPLEKGMATHSNILAWRIPWTEEPDGLQSIGSQRVGHNQVTNTFTLR